MQLEGIVVKVGAASKGLPAGSQEATTYVKAYSVESFDRLTAVYHDVWLDFYIDDLGATVIGPAGLIVRRLMSVARDLKGLIEYDLGCKVSPTSNSMSLLLDGCWSSCRRLPAFQVAAEGWRNMH